MQKGGRKIKRSKSLYGVKRRNKAKSAFTIVLMLVIVAGLVFLGYSVGEPIMNFFKNKAENQNTSSEPWSPSDVISNNSNSESSNIDENSSSSNSSVDEKGADKFSAFDLNVQDLQSEASLTSAIGQAKNEGYTAVVATLKSQGGAINYKSDVKLANNAAAGSSQITAAKIAEIIKQNNLIAVARVSTLYDNITPKADKTTGYSFENSDSSWYDNKPENGGKPWLNPFSETTKTFLSDISAEIYTAGFNQVICSDVIFPEFRTTDLNYIGTIVKDPNRYTALINVVDIFKNNASNTAATVSLEVSAKGIITGTEEVFKPDMLDGITIVADYDISKIGEKLVSADKEIVLKDLSMYEKTKTVFENVKIKSGSLEIIPCLVKEGMSDEDLSEAIRAINELGYSTYIVK